MWSTAGKPVCDLAHFPFTSVLNIEEKIIIFLSELLDRGYTEVVLFP